MDTTKQRVPRSHATDQRTYQRHVERYLAQEEKRVAAAIHLAESNR